MVLAAYEPHRLLTGGARVLRQAALLLLFRLVGGWHELSATNRRERAQLSVTDAKDSLPMMSTIYQNTARFHKARKKSRQLGDAGG